MKKQTENQMLKNNSVWIDYYNRLKLLATSIFEWEGLDDIGGNSRFLEKCLYEKGRACFIKDPELGYMTLNANPDGYYNVYGLPTRIRAYSNGYNKSFDLDDVVYIGNNDLYLPTYPTLVKYCDDLYEVDRTMAINIKAQKTPILIQGTDKQRLTLENLFMKYDGNMPFIFGDKSFNLDNCLKSINTQAPYVADKLLTQKHELWDDCLTFLGINNANTDKRERLIVDEVNANNELVNYYLNTFLKARLRACKEINDKFFNGENKITIRVNRDFEDSNLEEKERRYTYEYGGGVNVTHQNKEGEL